MNEKDLLAFPYITRKMLAFENGAAFDLEVITASKLATAIEITGMTREGPFKYAFTTNGSTAAQTTIFKIPDVPIWLTVKTAGIAASVNDVHAMVYVRVSETRLQLLCQGFLGQFHGINFPNQVPMTPLQQRGALSYTAGTDPAAGANASITVPTGEYWKVKQVKISLVTDATVADRSVVLYYRTPAAVMFNIVPAAVQVASKTIIYHWFEGAALKDDPTSLNQTIPLPADIILAPGYIIATAVKNLQAADDLSALGVIYERLYSA